MFDEGLRPVTLNVRVSQTQRIRLAIIACAISLSEKLSWSIEQRLGTYEFDPVGHGDHTAAHAGNVIIAGGCLPFGSHSLHAAAAGLAYSPVAAVS